MVRQAGRLNYEESHRARQLAREGHTINEIAGLLNRGRVAVTFALRPAAWSEKPPWKPGPGRLSAEEREEIRVGLAGGETFSAIASRLGRAVSTISREVAHNGGRRRYRAAWAHAHAEVAARRPKAFKLANPVLAKQVQDWLVEAWSPQQIASRLREDFPHDPMMWVSHETIYQALFIQGRGVLRKELARCLRSGRAQRRPQGRNRSRGPVPDMVMISDRPAEAEDRAVAGHWEGDLILGQKNASAVGTLVERSTRYVMLFGLPNGHTAIEVQAALTATVARLPASLFRSLTWDQGSEMATHRAFTMATDIQVYFCDPHSPWQRGSNENTNGLLRQFLPKGADLTAFSEADLQEIERKMNGRPRQTLRWRKPCEKLAELLALTG